MLTVKVGCNGSRENYYYSFVLIEEGGGDQPYVLGEREFVVAEEALMTGIQLAEKLNTVPFAPDKLFEIVEIEFVENENEDEDENETDEFETTSHWMSAKMIIESAKHLELTRTTHCQHRRDESFPVDLQVYRKLNGKISSEQCRILFDIFEEFVKEAVTGAPADRIMEIEATLRGVPYRQIAWDRWIEFMQRLGHHSGEARRIWDAVDSVHALT